VEDAEETILPTAEREVSHRSGDTDVDADIARGRFVAELARSGAAGGKERGLIAVGAAANKFCLLYTSPRPRDLSTSRMPSSA